MAATPGDAAPPDPSKTVAVGDVTASYHSGSNTIPMPPPGDCAAGLPPGRPFEVQEPVRTWLGGTVYRARQSRVDRTVLLRVLESEAASEPEIRVEFARTARALSRLSHPNVATGVLGAELDGPRPALAFIELAGSHLGGFGPKSWWSHRREPLYPNRRLAQAFLDAARGLAAIHQAGLIHGNLRPDALRSTEDDAVQLVGLGEDEGSLADAAAYAPPADRRDEDSRRRDVYALSAVFHELSTGTTPRAGEPTPPAKRLNPGISNALSDILGRGLSGDPNRRYPDAPSLISDLEEALATRVVPAPYHRRAWSLLVELLLASLGGAALVTGIAHLIGYRRGELPSFAEILALGAPAALCVTLAEAFTGETPLRRRLGLAVRDRGGDPPTPRRRRLRAVIKGGTITAVGILYAALMALVMPMLLSEPSDQDYHYGLLALLIVPLGVALALLLMPTLLTLGLQERRVLGLPSAFADEHDFPQVDSLIIPWHDVFADTRLVATRASSARPAEIQAPAHGEGEAGGSDSIAIDGYDVGPRLGVGAMGSVHRAWDRALGRAVALKFLGHGLRDAAISRERFEREGRLAARLDHPNVASIFGAGGPDDNPYIAMELIEGETLQQRVERRGPLPPAEAWGYALQVVDALRAADRLGIVHRDIKPSNLMIDGRGVVKLTDFGVARSDGDPTDLTGTGGVVGTPLYMPPEQATGREVDRRSDMYAVGMTLYYLLLGRTAFPAPNRMDLLARQMTESPPPLLGVVPGLTAEQDAIILRLLEREKERRFPDCDALRDALLAESPGLTEMAPISSRLADGALHLAACVTLLTLPTQLVALVEAMTRSGVDPLATQAALLSDPGYLLGWRVLATLITAAVVAFRPPLYPFRTGSVRSWRDVAARAGNLMYLLLLGLLALWPSVHRALGLRVVRPDGRRIGLGRAAARFAVCYPYLLPWTILGFLPGVNPQPLHTALGALNLAVLVVSAGVLLLHPRRRHLGDLVTDTLVLKTSSPRPSPLASASPAPPIPERSSRRPRYPERLIAVGLSIALAAWTLGTFIRLRDQALARRAGFRAHEARMKQMDLAHEARMKQIDAEIEQLNIQSTQAALGIIGAYAGKWDRAEREARRGAGRDLAPDRIRAGRHKLRGFIQRLAPSILRSPRSDDGRSFVFAWELDPRLDWIDDDPNKLLACEPSPDASGGRFALMADGKTVRYLSKGEFEAVLPAHSSR